jgi:hypothetical protein
MLDTDHRRVAYERAVLSEIRMLLDYLAADPNSSVASLSVTDAKTPGEPLDINGILVRIGEIEARITTDHATPLDSRDYALLLVVRDTLVRATRPASGLTIAYTAMVSGNRRGHVAESRNTLAYEAYPGVARIADFHRTWQRILLCFAVLMTIVTVWQSAQVALGRSLLQNLDGLRVQQAGLMQEKVKLEAVVNRPGDYPLSLAKLLEQPGPLPLSAFNPCDHPYVLAYYLEQNHSGIVPTRPRTTDSKPSASQPRPTQIASVEGGAPVSSVPQPAEEKLKIYLSAAERDVCERDAVLAINFSIVQNDLVRYRADWPAMVGGLFAVPAALARLPCLAFGCTDAKLAPNQKDIEFVIAPALLVWSNYALPVLFGLLGSIIYVIMDFYAKVRGSRLHPRDTMLAPIRIVLGLATGTCIGLFFSAAGPAASGGVTNLAAAMTVSASGFAFLAGFGVETVFTMLDTVVQRVFSTEPAGK